ncbi:hypothetical protein [Mycolicibacterium thermoresistibile]
MRFRLLPYVTVDVDDDRLRRRVRRAGERLRTVLTSYLRSAADDVETAGDRVRDLCDAAVDRVDTAVANVNDRIAPTPTATASAPEPSTSARPKRHLRAV